MITILIIIRKKKNASNKTQKKSENFIAKISTYHYCKKCIYMQMYTCMYVYTCVYVHSCVHNCVYLQPLPRYEEP